VEIRTDSELFLRSGFDADTKLPFGSNSSSCFGLATADAFVLGEQKLCYAKKRTDDKKEPLAQGRDR
jgi:hypothetical protein